MTRRLIEVANFLGSSKLISIADDVRDLESDAMVLRAQMVRARHLADAITVDGEEES